MGCCFSSSTARKPSQSAPAPPSMPPKAASPPPQPQPAPEEETVKEVVVLSEKHVARPKQPEIVQITQPDRSTEDLQAPVKLQHRQGEGEISDVSQTSDVPSNSVTETFSTATTATNATVKEDEATSRAVGQRSPAKTVRKRPFKGDQGTGRARRLEASTPEKRVRGRGRGPGEVRNAVRTNVGSRSRSPATARAGGVGRSSGKVCEKSEGRPKPSMSARGGAVAGAGAHSHSGEVGIQSNPAADAKNDVVPDQVGNESLELECFIFL